MIEMIERYYAQIGETLDRFYRFQNQLMTNALLQVQEASMEDVDVVELFEQLLPEELCEVNEYARRAIETHFTIAC